LDEKGHRDVSWEDVAVGEKKQAVLDVASRLQPATQAVITKSGKMLQCLVVVTSYIKVTRRYEVSQLFVIQSRDCPALVTQNHSCVMIIATCDTDIRVYCI
jgi:hypothetical protein